MKLELKKFTGSIGLVDDGNSDNVLAADGVSVYICRPGGTLHSANTLSTSSPALVDGGDISSGDELRLLRSDGTLETPVFTVDTVASSYGTAADVLSKVLTFSNVTGAGSLSGNVGDRFVRADPTSTGDQATIYSTGYPIISNRITQPLTTSAEGKYEFYANVGSFDVYVSGATVDDGWYAVDVQMQPIRENGFYVKYENVTADTAVAIDDETVLGRVITNTNPVSTIVSAYPGRVLLLQGSVNWTLTTTASVTANRVVVPSGAPSSISVDADDLVVLCGNLSGTTFYWTIARVVGVELSEIADTSISTPASGEVLKYDGSNWVNSSVIGTSANPISELLADSGAIKIVDGSGDVANIAFSGTTDRTITFPDDSGTVMLTGATQTVTGTTTFDDNAFEVRDPASTTKKARLDCGGVSAGNTRVLTVPDKDITIADNADIPSLGVAGNGATFFAVSTGGLNLTQPSTGETIEIVTGGAIPSDRQLYIKGGIIDGDYVVTSVDNIKHVGKHFGASGDAAGGGVVGWGWLDTLANTGSQSGNALLIFRTEYAATLVKAEINLWSCAAIGSAGDYTLQLYHGSSLPTASTIPPGSSSAMLGSAISMPAGGAKTGGSYNTFADASIPADDFVYIALASGSTAPSADVILDVSLTFWEQVL